MEGKNMFKAFSKLRTILKEKFKNKSAKTDECGRAIVEMTVRDSNDFISKYSTSKNEVISSDVAEFIEKLLEPIPQDLPIKLVINTNVCNEEEKKRYSDAIHNYFAYKCEKTLFKKHKLNMTALGMVLISVTALAFNIIVKVLYYTEAFDFLDQMMADICNEVIDIFAWVFMWEAVDIKFIQCPFENLERKKSLHLSQCAIEFKEI